MTITQHRKVVENSQQASAAFADLFAQVGNADNPRGDAFVAYRTARAALRGNLSKPRFVADVLSTMRDAIETTTGTVMTEAVNIGTEKAAFELDIYGLPKPDEAATGSAGQGTVAVMAVVDNQIAVVRNSAAAGMDEDVILGDGGNVGLLTPGPALREEHKWIVALAVLVYADLVSGSLRRAGATADYVKQAVAVLDGRTTNTCLQVHGQVTSVNGVFKIEGTPRFANAMSEPPFHWNCRTTTALVSARDASDKFTDDLINQRTELLKQAREEEEGRVSERIGNA